MINGLDDGGAEGVLYRLCIYDKEHDHFVLSMRDLGKYGTALTSKGIKVSILNISKLIFDFAQCHIATLSQCHDAGMPHFHNATLPHRRLATLSQCYIAHLIHEIRSQDQRIT